MPGSQARQPGQVARPARRPTLAFASVWVASLVGCKTLRELLIATKRVCYISILQGLYFQVLLVVIECCMFNQKSS
eukprot:16438873-Heterocapsa_arctica.AAC.1